MALNTGLTAKVAASSIGVANSLKKYSTVVDVTALTGGVWASGDHVKLFTIPAGTVFQFGTFEVLTVDAGGGAINIDLATSSTHVFHTQSALGTKVCAKMDHENVVVADQAEAAVYAWSASAGQTTGKYRITMWCVDNAGEPASV